MASTRQGCEDVGVRAIEAYARRIARLPHEFRDALDGFLATAAEVEVGIDDDVTKVVRIMGILDPVEKRASDHRLCEILPDSIWRRVHKPTRAYCRGWRNSLMAGSLSILAGAKGEAYQ